jgi:hypothetical protein
MNGHAYPDKPIAPERTQTLVACLVLVGLAVVAVLAVIAPTANAAALG